MKLLPLDLAGMLDFGGYITDPTGDDAAMGKLAYLCELINAHVARQAAAPADARDALRLDWIARQGDEFVSGIIVDRPGDGDYYVYGCDTIAGQGKTFLEALDSAMADAALARQAAAPAEGAK